MSSYLPINHLLNVFILLINAKYLKDHQYIWLSCLLEIAARILLLTKFFTHQIRLRVSFIYSLSWDSLQRKSRSPSHTVALKGDGWSFIFRPHLHPQIGLRGWAAAPCAAGGHPAPQQRRLAGTQCSSITTNRQLPSTCCCCSSSLFSFNMSHREHFRTRGRSIRFILHVRYVGRLSKRPGWRYWRC